MDDVVVEALRHVSGQLNDPTELFQALHDDHEATGGSDFDAFRAAFLSRGFGAPGEELARYLDDNGRLDLVAKVVENRPDELAAAYWALEAAAPEPDADDPEAQAAWQALLSAYSEHWDGAEENWQAFEEYVLYYAAEQGLTGPAQRFFARAATEDKVALFAENGVDRQAGAAAGESEDALWQTAIEQFGAAWAAWDGSEAGWAEYRDWFYDATASQDPAMYALAYERLQPLDAVAPDARAAQFGELGFDVSGASAGGATAADERLRLFQEVADDPTFEGIDREVLDQLLQDPDFDQRLTAAEAEVDDALADAG